MIWVPLRQHRMAILAMAALLGAVGVALVVSGLPMRQAFDDLGVAGCISQATNRCGEVRAAFLSQYNGLGEDWVPWLNFVPGLLGVFVGAPLIAREMEQGTHLLVWTQSTSRTRWLAVQLSLLLALTVVAAATFAAMMTWWRWPLDQFQGHFDPVVFDLEGPVVVAYAIFAFALGIAAGVLLRRSVIAMGATFAAFPAVRVPLQMYVRPHYYPPATSTFDPTAAISPRLNGVGNWILQGGWVDRTGHHLSASEETAMFAASQRAGAPFLTYMRDHGVVRWLEYQPADRLAAFQAIETAIFLALAATLLALALIWIRRRLA